MRDDATRQDETGDRLGAGDATQVLTALAGMLGRHLDRPRDQGPVSRPQPYGALREMLGDHLEGAGHGQIGHVLAAAQAYLDHAVRTDHAFYLNQLWAGTSLPALVGEMLAAASNTSMYTYEVAPAATVIERAMLARLVALTGFAEGEAQLTTGGSNGNALGLMLARDRAVPHAKTDGLAGAPPLAVFASADAHYSLDKAMTLLGLGTDALVKVPVDAAGAMRPDALAEAIGKARWRGRLPVAIVATAGTTVRGAFDPIAALADIAETEGMWLHVDGAWGGAMVLSDRHRPLLAGLERADSFVWDAHKMLGLPLMCSLLFCRERGAFARSFALGDTSYIFHSTDEDRPDLGPTSLQCGRRVDILKLWLEWEYHGAAGLGARVDGYIDLAARAEEIVAADPALEIMAPRWINTLCFRAIPPAGWSADAFNQAIRDRLLRDGAAMINTGRIDGALTLRLVLCNPALDARGLDELFARIRAAAEAVAKMARSAG